MERNKKRAAEAAMEYVKPDSVVGVGAGTTIEYFIEALTAKKNDIEAVVASSKATAEKLEANGFVVEDLNSVNEISVYVDSADEFNSHLQMLKGGGGAHTGEKILASASKQFVGIVDDSKESGVLGEKAPVTLEVLPMARSLVARHMVMEGGDPVYREQFETDHGNVILDVFNLQLLNPLAMERQLNQIPGIVCNGIFAQYSADILVVGTSGTTEVYHK